VDLYWILNGRAVSKNEEVVLTKASPTTPTVLEIENEVEIYVYRATSQPIDKFFWENSTASSQLQMNTESDIDKIVISIKTEL
jgi:hypothetical protein